MIKVDFEYMNFGLRALKYTGLFVIYIYIYISIDPPTRDLACT